MKTFAQFDDSTGTISSLTLIDAPSGVSGGVILEPGTSIAEIADIELAMDEAGHREAAEVIERFRVVPQPSGPVELSEIRQPKENKS